MTFDCQSCGACCNRAPIVQIRDKTLSCKDVSKLHKRCSALEGKVGKHVSCSIYNERPRACRMFEPGSEECIRDRLREGIFS